MDKTAFPQVLIFDIHDIVAEFMSVYKPGGGPLDTYDLVFVEEVLTVLHPAFLDTKNFEKILSQQMIYFADNTVHYRDDVYNPGLLMSNASVLAFNLLMKLMMHNVFINGFFPYVFRQMTYDQALIFEFAPEYVGDRYCDPRP